MKLATYFLRGVGGFIFLPDSTIGCFGSGLSRSIKQFLTMSNDRQQVSYGHGHAGVTVSGLGPPKDHYEPKKHNKAAPLRVGAIDAFNQPSLDHTGERKPYWGSTE